MTVIGRKDGNKLCVPDAPGLNICAYINISGWVELGSMNHTSIILKGSDFIDFSNFVVEVSEYVTARNNSAG